MVKRILFLSVVALSALSVSAQSVSSISVTNVSGTLSLKKKNMQALQIEVLPADAANKAVSYTVDYSAVATVNASGEITGVSAGQATVTITAQDGSNVSTTLPVTVTDRSPEMPVNDPTGPFILYSTSGDKVVTVDADGYIVEKFYAKISDNYTFTVTSAANEAGKTTPSSFAVTLHPLSRPAAVQPAPDSLIVLSDPHGNWTAFTSILKAKGVIDNDLKWKFGANQLLVNGDLIDSDSGKDDALAIFWLLYQLQQEAQDAGGKVYVQFGNHELSAIGNNNPEDSKFKTLASKYSMSFGRSGLFSASSELGRWFRDALTFFQIVGKDFFVHGGLSNAFYTNVAATSNLDQLNTNGGVQMISGSGRNAYLFAGGATETTGGPLWYRGLCRTAGAITLDRLLEICQRHNVDRIVIGHTEVQSSSNRVTSTHPTSYNYYNYRVLNVNVPVAKAYSAGNGRGALILKDGSAFCIYDKKANTPITGPEGVVPPGDPNTNTVSFEGGTGTETDPYLVKTAEQLDLVRDYLSDVEGDKIYFKQIADIDLTSYLAAEYPDEGWLPIGVSGGKRFGIYDGDNHKITGLWINRPAMQRVGLFGMLSTSSKIANLGVEIDTKGITGLSYAGGLVGQINDLTMVIENCYVTGNVTGVGASPTYAGLLAGYNIGTITNSYAIGTVTGTGVVGGLCGGSSTTTNSYMTFTNCYADVLVIGTTLIGGLVGQSSSSASATKNVTNTYFNAEINAAGLNSFGSHPAIATTAGKTGAELKTQSTFVDWDFTHLWKIDEGARTPYFQWQTSGPGGAVAVPTYSTPGNEIWYYIQFAETGLVVQSNGTEAIATAETLTSGLDNQLWKFEATGNTVSGNGFTGDEVTISSKANPSLKLRYNTTSSSRWKSTTATSYTETGLLPHSFDHNGISCSALWGYTTNSFSYLLRPYGGADTAGTELQRNPNGTTTVLLDNAVVFVPTGGVGYKTLKKNTLKVYPSPAADVVYVDLPESATKISISNIAGQTFKSVALVAGRTQIIPVSDLASGIYILKVEKKSGVEVAKFSVK
ncbi:MAG: Ig-like domain-containing protein [Dysgonamonadaceae bacterium]|jgi:hypothetical protein|nr:Ig-like domain-containing protein [Dysgonamonadaceae bacterium]